MKKIFSFSDTTGRVEFFFVSLAYYLIFIYILLFATDNSNHLNWVAPPFLIPLIPMVLAIICRRLNDIGKSRFLTFVVLIPFVNLIFLLYLVFAPSKLKSNTK